MTNGAGFGQLIVDGKPLPDPYVDGLDDHATFEVVSDDGRRYRIDREREGWWPRWNVYRTDPLRDDPIGTVTRNGNRITGFGYRYAIGDSLLPAGQQAMLINAVFSLI
jgi:hypothetical protein